MISGTMLVRRFVMNSADMRASQGRKPRIVALLISAIAFMTTAAVIAADVDSAATPDARAIMEKNYFVSKLKSLRSDATMILINDKGQTRERKTSTIQRLQPNGVDSNLLVRFSQPADIKGTAFLQIEHSDGDDDEWLYLPALGKSRRLVANNKKDSFVGSDFSYGDISLPKVDLYQHKLLRSESIDGFDCYVVESIPKNDATKSDFGYARKITWVRKDNFLETKVEYYDLANQLFRTQHVTEHKLIEPAAQRWMAMHREMTNWQTNHRTVFKFDKVESGVAVSDDQFSTRYLERE